MSFFKNSLKQNKTYKREVAVGLVIWLIWLAEAGNIAALTVVAWPVFLFLGAAYGMEWASKQTNIVGSTNDIGER